MEKQPIGIGTEDFRMIREHHALYVDKSLFIRDFVQSLPTTVSLFLRPRRFGKTLLLSMLKYFFSDDPANHPETWFQGLAIMRYPEIVQSYMGRFPVVSQPESGAGYPDIVVRNQPIHTALFACKKAREGEDLEHAARRALAQEEGQSYAERHRHDRRVDVFGVAFQGKRCLFIKKDKKEAS